MPRDSPSLYNNVLQHGQDFRQHIGWNSFDPPRAPRFPDRWLKICPDLTAPRQATP